MLAYTYDENQLVITETANEADVEFRIRVLGDDAPVVDKLKKIQHDFEHNEVLTDVQFYAYLNHEYQFIVRRDFYDEFVLALMKYRLLRSVEWK